MIRTAVLNLYPEASFGHNGTIDSIEPEGFFDLDLVLTEFEVLRAEYTAQEYSRNRLEAYNVLNQFELISDDSINGTTTHKDAILAIKAEFPKP
jgi:hypothetical protein